MEIFLQILSFACTAVLFFMHLGLAKHVPKLEHKIYDLETELERIAKKNSQVWARLNEAQEKQLY
jgi:hypothetical protein